MNYVQSVDSAAALKPNARIQIEACQGRIERRPGRGRTGASLIRLTRRSWPAQRLALLALQEVEPRQGILSHPSLHQGAVLSRHRPFPL